MECTCPKISTTIRRRACITAKNDRAATLRHQICNDDEFYEKIRVQVNGLLPSRVHTRNFRFALEMQ